MTSNATEATAPDRSNGLNTVVRHAIRLLPRRSDYAELPRSWRYDLMAGITVGVVALPLALAFGVTSGLGAEAGLITAIIAGVVAAVFGGSNLQVSGPTGAMTVVLLPVVARHGVGAVMAVAVIAGLVITAMGLLGLGRAVSYIPWPVVSGFTVGIATIIGLQQVPFALDVPTPDGENTALVALKAVALAAHPRLISALALVALVIAVMLVLPRIRRTLPASLIAVVVATVAAELLNLPVARIGAIPNAMPAFAVPALDSGTVSALLSSALAVAALGAIESLLSARVADGMTDTTKTDPDRELVGQGLANVASGLFGGMPATGAIARTAVNVRAGARTRVSSIVHSVVLVAVVLFGSGLVAVIPLPALAGVLIVTAFRMVEPRTVLAIWRTTRSDALVMAATALATVVFDLIVAVEIGIGVAALLALRSVARASGARLEPIKGLVPAVRLDQEATVDGTGPIDPVDENERIDAETELALLHENIAVYRIDGALFFGAAQRFLDELATVGDVRVVVLRLSNVKVVDATGANALAQIVADLERRGSTVLIKGVRPQHLPILRAVGVLDELAHERHLFDTLDDALEHARLHVRRVQHAPHPQDRRHTGVAG
ncbi:MAG TPA: SulP family inorganic anion transporter [Actinomycetales bacterium]|nr:SulP family inorganic anion transporter [Actinomycetales bacterium]